MITELSPILQSPSATAAQAATYVLRRGSAYSAPSIYLIVSCFWKFAPQVGIDPVLGLAQSIHETSENGEPFSSWWAQRPRRNSAGMGVTGRVQEEQPADVSTWAYDERTGVWRHGLSFATWEASVRSQLGRLLLYALPASAGDAEQQARMFEALLWRPFPLKLRGSAPILKCLGARHNPTGDGWANPGYAYGASIAEIANAIARV